MNSDDLYSEQDEPVFESAADILQRAEDKRMGERLSKSRSREVENHDGPPPSDSDDETTPQPTVPLQAQIAERRKRQDAEARLAELQLQSGTTSPIAEADASAALEVRLAMSEQLAQASYPDYDEVVAPVLEAIGSKPELADDLMAEAHPAEMLYQLGREWQLVEQAGGIDGVADHQFRAGYDKARAEHEASMQEYKAQVQSSLLPPSFAEVSAPGMRPELEVRDTPLSELLQD